MLCNIIRVVCSFELTRRLTKIQTVYTIVNIAKKFSRFGTVTVRFRLFSQFAWVQHCTCTITITLWPVLRKITILSSLALYFPFNVWFYIVRELNRFDPDETLSYLMERHFVTSQRCLLIESSLKCLKCFQNYLKFNLSLFFFVNILIAHSFRTFSDYFFLGLGRMSTSGFHEAVVSSIRLLHTCTRELSLRACVYSKLIHTQIKVTHCNKIGI